MLRKVKKNYIKYIAMCLAILQIFTSFPANIHAAEDDLKSITSEDVEEVETENIISDDLNTISEKDKVTETQESFDEESKTKEYQEKTESVTEIKRIENEFEIKKEIPSSSIEQTEKKTMIDSNIRMDTSLLNIEDDINDPFVGATYTGRAYMVYDGAPDSEYTGQGGYIVCTSGPFEGMSIFMDTCLSGREFSAPQTGQEGTYTIQVTEISGNTATIYGVWENDYYSCGYQDVGGYSTYMFNPVPKNGNIEIQKTSANPEITNGNDYYDLSGAVYGIYNDVGELYDSITTDENGYGISADIPAGTFNVKEITAPKGYSLDDTTYSITITASQTTSLAVSDIPLTNPIAILLNKKDSVTNEGLKDAEFTIKFYGVQNETDLALAEHTPLKTWVLRTDENGIAGLESSYLVSGDSFYYNESGQIAIPFGTITIQETKAPDGYELNDEVFVRDIKEGETSCEVITYNAPTIPNTPYQAKGTVTKTDCLTGKSLAGATFKMQEWNGSSYVDSSYSVTWNSTTGLYEIDTLYYTQTNKGKYQIVEVTNPYGYVGTWSQEFAITQNNQSFSFTASNKQVRAEVKLNKTDRESTLSTAQGDATLENAVYEIYFDETVTHPDGTVYYKGDLAGTETTDKNGELTFKSLLPCKYYIVEKTPSNGYLLDETVYYADCTHDGIETSISELVTVTEQIKKQAFELIKISSDGSSGETELLEKAGFKTYLISDLSGVANGTLTPSNGSHYTAEDFASYDFTNENTAIDYSSGTAVNIAEMFTDSKGYAVSTELAYGSYVIVESTTPQNHETIKPFLVTITEDSRTPQSWRIFNDSPFEFYLKIVKKDFDTKETVLKKGASYIIEKEDGSLVEQTVTYPKPVTYGTLENPFTVTEDGYLVTPQKLKAGTYKIKEVSAPEGYILSPEPIIITVDSNTAQQVDESTNEMVVVAEQYNKSVKGEIIITKIDEVTEEKLEGAVFELIADEDIVSPDGSGTIIASKNQVVDIIKTDINGIGKTKELYLGNYRIKEIESPFGYGLMEKEINVSVKYADMYTSVVRNNVVAKNKKMKIETTATNKETGSHSVLPVRNVSVVDEINYENLVPNVEYTIKGILMDKESGKEVLINGEKVVGEIKFIPEKPDGKVQVEFTFDAVNLEGKKFVIFEDLIYQDKLITAHADLANEKQTIHVTEPKIGTTATNKKTGTHSVLPVKNVTIVDEIKYKNLVPDVEYTIKGILMDKKSGKELLINGERVVSEIKFIPEKPDGKVQVEFTFDAVNLAEKELVVFEDLFYQDKLIASHSDLNDEGQTVIIEKKNNTNSPNNPNNPIVPKTGDSSNVVLFGIIALIAMGAAIVTIVIIKKTKRIKNK